MLTPILENKSKTHESDGFTILKYGRNAISIAQAGIKNDWKMRREHSSKVDTASFDLLPKLVYRNKNGVSKTEIKPEEPDR